MKSTIPVPGALRPRPPATMALTGCATTSDVDKKIAEVQAKTDKKIESVETQVEELQEKQKATDGRLDEQGKQIEQLGQSAAEALKRAQEAGVLAKGKVVFQQSFTEDRIRFKTASYELTKDAKAALDEFAAKVKESGQGGLPRDPGAHRRHGRLGVQRHARTAAGRGRPAVPVARAQASAGPDVDDLLRRHAAGGIEQDGQGAVQEPPGRHRRPRVIERKEKKRRFLLEGCARAQRSSDRAAATVGRGPTHTF